MFNKLILPIFESTKNFSKAYKYTLGQDQKRDGINLGRSIYRANKSKKNKIRILRNGKTIFPFLFPEKTKLKNKNHEKNLHIIKQKQLKQ